MTGDQCCYCYVTVGTQHSKKFETKHFAGYLLLQGELSWLFYSCFFCSTLFVAMKLHTMAVVEQDCNWSALRLCLILSLERKEQLQFEELVFALVLILQNALLLDAVYLFDEHF